jgi:hypothetical protein
LFYWLGELLLLEPLLVMFIPGMLMPDVVLPPLVTLLPADALVLLSCANTSVVATTAADTANAATIAMMTTIAIKFNLRMHFLKIFHRI